MSPQIMKQFYTIHLVLSLIINTVHPYLATINTAKLSPAQTSYNGARVMSNIQEVFRGTTNNWDVRMRYQNTWQFIIAIDHTFGFDSSTQSSVDITIDIPISNTQELVFGFTKDNKEYISISIPLINSGGSNKIFPACNQLAGFMPFAFGDIASIPTFNRVCDIAENSCTNWKNMLPPNSETVKSPITFTLENDPSNNQLIFYFQSQTISNTEILQTCKFDVGTNFKINNGLKIYMAGGYPGETYSINSIDITSYIKIPTVSPTKAPTNIPSISPTKNPSISPTFHPTNNPSITPTNQPTKSPSHNPSITPSKFPSYNPSISPTNRPTVNTPAPITTRPTYNPSFQPTNNPIRATLKPTNNPITIRPSMNPVRATPIGFQYGNYGQLCANNIHDQCEIQSNILSNMNILCATPYECCMCKTIQCGINNTPCNQFLVTGDYAMYGVKDIHIIGNNGNIYSTNGVSIDCKGIQSCKNTNIIASGINYIDCDGNNACQMAVIQITNPKNGFHLECNGVESCAGLQIEIILSGPPGGYYCNPNRAQEIFQFSKIACNNNNACDGLEIIIKNEGCDRIIIQDLECIQPNACNNAIFNLIGDVRIDNCLCGVSCNTAIGLNQCWNNLDNYICSDRRSCAKQIKTFENPRNAFEFKCSAFESCRNSNFKIQLNIGNVEYISGLLMDGAYSAADSIFIIDNKQGFVVRVGRIQCSGTNSCNGTTFIIGVDVMIEEIICAPESCVNCQIKTNINGVGIPCDASQV